LLVFNPPATTRRRFRFSSAQIIVFPKKAFWGFIRLSLRFNRGVVTPCRFRQLIPEFNRREGVAVVKAKRRELVALAAEVESFPQGEFTPTLKDS
jgi:hypothetical protein